MTKVYMATVQDCAGGDDNLGIFSSVDLAEAHIHKTYEQNKGDWVWEGRAWYIYIIEVDHPDARVECILINVYDRPVNQ